MKKTLTFNKRGNLTPGKHFLTWDELMRAFGTNAHRKTLLAGMKRGLQILKKAGCKRVYIDGSFVTLKKVPGDYDLVWDERHVNTHVLQQLEPLFYGKFRDTTLQRKKYLGEYFPAMMIAIDRVIDGKNPCFLDMFQTERYTDYPKGIVSLDLQELL
ncbi:hypothetical protein A374_14055 [Fictibacillus macauensis ZFHKF-1]|uniref:Uncharacterized protein n=1 Tax=Fictibacillus macauensis ZFHKF-1 TaxID=1196324 RepID=I8IZ97_9BACL|nr:hypothetical protein [Fictibacillus macauensis]EIT84821.1 hypothetical protein A374_14055 [Fictibacillus macauensis ZFHKF-1]